MANVIEIIIRAKDQTTAAISSATKQMESLNVAGKLTAVQFAVVGGAIAASVGTFTALAGVARSSAESLDRLNEVALQTGVAASTLSQLQFAASQTNASLEGLNTGLRFLARNLYAARTGGDEQAKAFQALGFSAKEVASGLGGTEQAFLKIADRLASISDPGTKAALALKIFGRGAAELIPLLSSGSVGIAAYRAEADRLQITVSNTAAALGDEFGDAVKAAHLQVDALKASIAEALLPAMIQAVRGTQGLLAEVIKFTKANPALVSTLFQVSGAFSALAIGIGSIVGAVALAKAALSTLGLSASAAAAAGGPIALLIAGLGLLAGAIIYARERAEEPLRVRVITNAAEAGAELARLSVLREQLQSDLDRQTSARGPQTGNSPIGEAISAAARTAVGLSPFGDGAEKIAKTRAELTKLDASLKAASDAAKAMVAGTDGALDGLNDDAKKGADLLGIFNRTLRDAYLVADRVGLALKAAFGLDQAAKLIDTIQKGLLPIFAKPLTLKIKTEFDVGPDAAGRKPGASPALPTTPASLMPISADANDAIDGAAAGIAQIVAELEAAGISGEKLTDTLAKTGKVGIDVGDAFGAAFTIFREGIDPARGLITDLSNTMFDFVDGFGAAVGGMFDALTKGGQSFHQSMVGFLNALYNLTFKLIGSLLTAIAKAVFLRAITGSITGGASFFFSGGGTVPALASGGSVRGAAPALPALASGGTLPRWPVGLAEGGAVIRAASGVRVVPGNAQAYDSVPAMLAPGEVVLPTIGGRMPGDLLGGLDQLGKDLSRLMARAFVPPGMQAAGAGSTYNIHTVDAASFRTLIRRGDLAREGALAADPARD